MTITVSLQKKRIIFNMDTIQEVTNKLIKFRDKREWKQFHKPKDVAISLNLEAAEVLEQ